MGSGFMRLARATGPAKDKRLALDLILASDAGGRVRALRLFRAWARARSRACRRFAPVQRSPCMGGSASEPLSEVKHEVDEGRFGSDVF